VVKGVRDYGNRMGIPTVAGALFFDKRFLGNPLVYCGTLGLIRENSSFKEVKKGHLIILCGAKTGRDGIHGATFSSQELDEITSHLRSAVQIGNPIEEKKLTEAILRATHQNLISALTDCGAGGICCAITELAKNFGAEVYLEKVPLKYKGLSYTEIWISESQERMVLFVEEKNLEKLRKIFEEEEVEFTVVGKVTDTKKILVFYQGNCVCELDLDFLFSLPKLEKKAVWIKKKEERPVLEDKDNYNEDLKKLLGSPNISCKDWILREYDHEVQAGSVVKSIYGIEKPIVSDVCVIRPDLKSKRCVAIGVGINPSYSDFDPYIMASLVLEEALRNVSCCGASLEKTFILDNFSWGSPEDKINLGGLVRASLGCKDFSLYYQVPFISGKDSLYNEYAIENKRIIIPGTLLISAVCILDDPDYIPSSVFLKEGNLIYLIGLTKPELGCSEYFRMLKIKKGILPKIEKKIAKDIFFSLNRVIKKKLVVSCHDLSEGGLVVALAEMCMQDKGASIFLEEVPRQDNLSCTEILFSESPTRFLVEVEKEKKEEFEKEFKNLPIGLVGCVSNDKKLVIYNKECKKIIDLEIEDLRKSWLNTFQEFRKNPL
jgi:phosphoribosylformylglycinamidine synthase